MFFDNAQWKEKRSAVKNKEIKKKKGLEWIHLGDPLEDKIQQIPDENEKKKKKTHKKKKKKPTKF